MSITIADFDKDVLRTANKGLSHEKTLLATALGQCGEAGEAAENIKKHVFHDHDLDIAEQLKELGDQLYYISWQAQELGFSLEEVMTRNMAKRLKRYPIGFDSHASMNRVEYQELSNQSDSNDNK